MSVEQLINWALMHLTKQTLTQLHDLKWSDPLDLAELHSFRLVYFKHKEIFLVVCMVSR